MLLPDADRQSLARSLIFALPNLTVSIGRSSASPAPAEPSKLQSGGSGDAPGSGPQIVEAGGMVFGEGQLVRLALEASDTAAEEASFVGVLEAFLDRACAAKETISARSEAVQVCRVRLNSSQEICSAVLPMPNHCSYADGGS